MDNATSNAQKITDQPVNRAQPPVASPPTPTQGNQQVPPPPPSLQPQSGSVNKEAGPTMIAQEAPDENDEEEIKPASQETKTQVMQQGGVEAQEVQEVEVQPSIPEAKIEKSVENVVEKAPDQEKPVIPQVVKDAGVTHSGPGMITVEENTFGVTTLPKTYQQAALEEKQTKIKDSKHWLLATLMYVWRKLNPNLGKKGAKG